MYSTDKGKGAKRPIVGSQAAAVGEMHRWLSENQYDHVLDGEGWPWRLDVRLAQVDDPADPRRVLCQASLRLTTTITAAALAAGGVLDPVTDARLLGLIGDEQVPMSMKPQTYTAPDEAGARAYVIEQVPKLKESLALTSLVQVKRGLVARWVDGRCQLGGLKG